MTAAQEQMPPGAQEMYRSTNLVTPESVLLDTAERIGRIREGRVALQVHLSKLLPQNRQTTHLRIAARMFDPLVTGYRCQVFQLTRGDIIVIGADIPDTELENAVNRLRALFNKDPLTFAEFSGTRDPFYSFYDLEVDYADFLTESERLRDEVEALKKQPAGAGRGDMLEDITPESLDDMCQALEGVDISQVMKRQAIVQVVRVDRADVIFQEFFLSMNDLRKMIAPNVNLFANKWLFQHLTLEVDKKVLTELTHPQFVVKPKAMSLNLNLASVATKEFEAFEASLTKDQTLYIEVPMVDVFGDVERFFRLRDELRERGHKVVMDSLTPSTLHFADTSKFDVDGIKVAWSHELAQPVNPDSKEDPAARIAEAGPGRVILNRCDSEASIMWGLQHGVFKFQGNLVDKMLGAITLHGCEKGRNVCKITECISRRGMVSRGGRQGCLDFQQLDSFPPIDLTKLPSLGRKK